jgi:hypothetical protein
VSSVASRVRPAVTAIAAAAGVLATVAGCSSASSSSVSPASSTPAATVTASPPAAVTASPPAAVTASPTAALPAPSMTPLPASAGQLSGTQLESVLLPEADFPGGYATPTSGPVSSGGSLTSGPATYNLATISCATFVQHFGTVGFGETAMVFGSVSAGYQAFDELIYQFATAPVASSFVSGIQQLAGRCGAFKVTANGDSGTFSLKASPGTSVGGHPTVNFAETGTLGGNKDDLDLLLSASGVDVFAGGGVGDGGAAAPTEPTKEVVVYDLMRRQAAVVELD